MKKIFIYYSYTGNGDAVAEYLKEKGFEIRKVIPQKKMPKSRVLGIIVGGYKASVGYLDKLCDFNSDLSDYDEVWIGSPVWNARLSSPINTVLSLLELGGKKVTFSGGVTAADQACGQGSWLPLTMKTGILLPQRVFSPLTNSIRP